MNLAQFYHATNGGRDIPRAQRPTLRQHLGTSLSGEKKNIVAHGSLDSRHFKIFQNRHNAEMQMEIRTAEGVLCEVQEFYPQAKAHTHHITTYDETGRKIATHNVYSMDGRIQEEVSRTPNHQLSKIIHNYPDLEAPAYNERAHFGKSIMCQRTLQRKYHDNEGNCPEVDEYQDNSTNRFWEDHYDETGQYVHARIEYKPGSRATYERVTTFDDKGLIDSLQEHDKDGIVLHYVEYNTDHATQQSETIKKGEKHFTNGFLRTEMNFDEHGHMISRTTYKPDSHHKARYEKFAPGSEHPRLITYYRNGVIQKILVMKEVNGEQEVQRTILYNDEGKPYRSRDRRQASDFEEFWSEAEINPETRMVSASVWPSPNGLIRLKYDEVTGKLRKRESHREDALGGTLEQVSYYHNVDKDAKNKVPRVEYYEQDGSTMSKALGYRKTDSSIKYRDERNNDDDMVRKVYPSGTRYIEDDTPILYERTQGPDGTTHSASLYAHNDPAIKAMHYDYGPDGKPTKVHVHSIDGSTTMPWSDYIERKKEERSARPPVGHVTLATVNPDIRKTAGEQFHMGQAMITLQGSEEALNRARSQIRLKIPEAKVHLYIGENQWLQYRGMTGHYVENTPAFAGHPLLEKVNVLMVTVPYQAFPNEKWPQSTSLEGSQHDDLTTRGVEETARALTNICRYTDCDLRLALTPDITRHKTEDNKVEFHPYVRVSWPSPPYISAVQNRVLHEMISDILMQKNLAPTHIPGEHTMDVFVPGASAIRNMASRAAHDASINMTRWLVPAPLHSSEPEQQL